MPAPQRTQTVAPVAFEYVPVGQVVQEQSVPPSRPSPPETQLPTLLNFPYGTGRLGAASSGTGRLGAASSVLCINSIGTIGKSLVTETTLTTVITMKQPRCSRCTTIVPADRVTGTRHVAPDLSKGRKQEQNDQSPRNVELNTERPSTGSSPLRRLHPPSSRKNTEFRRGRERRERERERREPTKRATESTSVLFSRPRHRSLASSYAEPQETKITIPPS